MLLNTLGLSPPARGVPGNPPGPGGARPARFAGRGTCRARRSAARRRRAR
jgi:hypothetical protein